MTPESDPSSDHHSDRPTDRVVAACREMVRAGGPLPMDRLAAQSGCSPRTLSRSFASILGLTPGAFGQAVRTGHARESLRVDRSVTDAIFSAGFGSVRAFYETVPPTLGMHPRRYQEGADGECLRWATTATGIGAIVLVASDRGLAAVRIGADGAALVDDARAEFPGATFEHDDAGLRDALDAVVAISRGARPVTELPLDLRGTAFQARVWESLRRIPAGETRTYAQVARDIGSPGAVRAVGSACGANPVALVVPCHRVVRSDGGLGGYHWGIEVKQTLLDIERAANADPLRRAP